MQEIGRRDYLKSFSRRAVARTDDGGREAEACALVTTLSADELEALRGVVAGESTENTAQRLGISSRIAELHRRNMMDKLGAVRTCDAVRIGLYAGLDNWH